jgi:hypothetical protein
MTREKTAKELLESAKYELGSIFYEPVGEIKQDSFNTLVLDWWARRIIITDIKLCGSWQRRVKYYANSVELDMSKLYTNESEAKETGRRIAEDLLKEEIAKEEEKIAASKRKLAELRTAIPDSSEVLELEDEL